MSISRRHLLAGLAAGPLLAGPEIKRQSGTRVKIGLNAYSFNKPLMAGTMKIPEVIEYCAQQQIDGVDLTGYYFPGYPNVPSDEYIRSVKRTAFLNGVTIIGTGVRNDFTLTDGPLRKLQVQLVKNWVEVAAKLGSNMVRVFSGREVPKGYTFDQVLEYMVPAFKECADYGKQHGIIIGLQHHHDFLKTAEETIRVVKAVDSDWFSVILDVGSVRQGDPYKEIERLIPYASNWQIKEHVWYGEKKTAIDLHKLRGLIDKIGYRGFAPIEALGEGDPKEVVTTFLKQVRKSFA